LPSPPGLVPHATPPRQEGDRRHPAPSFAAWLLLVLYALIGAGNLIRGVVAFRTAPVYALWPWSIDPTVLGIVYVLLGLVILAAGVTCFRLQSPWARWTIRVTALAYQVTIWVIRLLGDRATYARRLWPRDLVITLIFLAVVLLLTSRSRRRHRQ